MWSVRHMIVGAAFMKSEWESMTIDELVALHEQMQEVLTVKIAAEKTMLESRLQTLGHLPARRKPKLRTSATVVRSADGCGIAPRKPNQ
jgi:hypothetical protein